VALPVIPVEVGIDDFLDRLLRDPLNLPVQRVRSGGLGVRVNDYNAVVGQNHGSVAVDLIPRSGDRCVDAVRDGLELEQVLAGGLGVGGEDAARVEILEGLNGRNRYSGAGDEFATRPRFAHDCPPPEGRFYTALRFPASSRALKSARFFAVYDMRP